MSAWTLRWHYAAIAALRAMPWREAAQVDAAVQRLQLTGAGRVERAGRGSNLFRLRVGRQVVLLEADVDRGELRVWGIYRAS